MFSFYHLSSTISFLSRTHLPTNMISSFHSLIGFCYLFAFISILIQYDGLYGYNGLLPSDVYVDHIRNHYMPMIANKYLDLYFMVPSISLFYRELGVSVDAINNFLMILGMLSSVLICTGFHSSILYLICFICYLSILTIGQVFLSFQWDTLLMEVGFLCIFASSIFYYDRNNASIINSVFRFLAFKLMFMSGRSITFIYHFILMHQNVRYCKVTSIMPYMA